jgi:carbon storage regulator
MLVLTRKPLQAFMIGRDVTVTVLGIKGNHVRIGIKAPKEIKVLRDELVEHWDGALPEAERLISQEKQ